MIAVVPLGAPFLAFQLFLLKLPRDHLGIILTGAMVAAVGLFLFLLGIGIGFLPFGRAIGAALATLDQPWLFVIVGLLLGYLTTWGEPAVRVLADQVEHVSQGSIHKSLVLYAICTRVALMVGLGVLRSRPGLRRARRGGSRYPPLSRNPRPDRFSEFAGPSAGRALP